MTWNHRILAYKELNGNVYLQVHEVHYSNKGEPKAYTDKQITIGGEFIKDITFTLNKILDCRKKPILWAGNDFPKEVKITYECCLCGRNKFTKKVGHTCNGNFRKRKLKWKIKYN